MKRLFVSTLVLISSATSASAGEIEDAVRDATEISDYAQALKPVRCDESPVRGVHKGLEDQREALAGDVRALQNRSAPDFVRFIALEKFKRTSSLIGDAHLVTADALLHAGCLEEADEDYRTVLSFFVGNQFAGFQRRAEVGIQDVREARRAGNSVPSAATRSQ